MKLVIFLALSFLLHLLVYQQLSGIDIHIKERPKPKVVDVAIVTKEKEQEPQVPVMPAYDPGAAEQGEKTLGSLTPASALNIPEISIPKIAGTEILDIKIPKLSLGSTNAKGTVDTDKELLSEINSASEKYHRSSSGVKGAASTGQKPGSDDGKDFFVIKNLSGSRKLVSVPEKPNFSLSTNTNVRVSFKVDREGSTYSILLLNRTDSNIERLAIDFVQKLKFNAVLDTSPEAVEIILYFRVR